MTIEEVKADITGYLNGSITLDELITRNDDAIDKLPDHLKGGPVWAISSDVEGLICEHVYQHIDEETFRARLGELA